MKKALFLLATSVVAAISLQSALGATAAESAERYQESPRTRS